MHKYQKFSKLTDLIAVISGGLLLSLAVIPLAAIAQQSSVGKLNPCPRIFYEEPHNNRVAVPQGCPPNAFTQRQQVQGTTPGATTPSDSVTQPPLPEQQQAPIATVLPTNGKVNVQLVNQTAASITYQVIGDTEPRTLSGKSDVMLQGLSTPVTVTFKRQDGGLLRVTPVRTSATGMLQVTLGETTDLGVDRSTMRIQENGSVFLN